MTDTSSGMFQPAMLGKTIADFGMEIKVGNCPLKKEAADLIADLLMWYPYHEDLVPRVAREDKP